MILLAVVSGIGIAIVHPEGLRAIHSLGRIPPAVSTVPLSTELIDQVTTTAPFGTAPPTDPPTVSFAPSEGDATG